MGLGFLTPMFFAGLAALTAPILVHLVRRRDPGGKPFPSLMFIEQIPYQAQRRRKIRHWVLLCLRCLALTAVVLAFAQPFITQTDAANAVAEDRRDVVILIDQSYSMGYGDHWTRARQAALDALDGLGPADRAGLVFFDDRPRVVSELTRDRDALRAAIEQREPGTHTTDIGVAIGRAAALLNDSSAPEREIVLVSDFQRSGLDPTAEVRLPAGARLTVVEIDSPEIVNAAVVSLTLTGETNNDRAQASARIVNTGNQEFGALPVTLEIDGRELAARAIRLGPGEMRTVTFELGPATDRASRGAVRIVGDRLSIDNRFHFVLAPNEPLPVLVVERSESGRAGNPYLASALAVSETPRFDVDFRRWEALQPTDLEGRAVVIIEDAPLPTGAMGASLKHFVEAGGGLIVVAGDGVTGDWPGGADGYAPGALGPMVDVGRSGAISLANLDYAHPMLDQFSGPRSGDFSGVRVSRYRRLEAGADDRVLASYDDGGVAIAERRVGNGRVLVITMPFEKRWNDLALKPVFVPLIHRTMTYLSGYVSRPAWYRIGDAIDLARHFNKSSQTAAVQSPSGAEEVLTGGMDVFTLEQPGWYEVHSSGVQPLSRAIAVNVDPAESDLTQFDAESFAATVNASADSTPVDASGPREELREPTESQWLGWYLLLAAMALLALDTIVSNTLSRAPTHQRAGA